MVLSLVHCPGVYNGRPLGGCKRCLQGFLESLVTLLRVSIFTDYRPPASL